MFTDPLSNILSSTLSNILGQLIGSLVADKLQQGTLNERAIRRKLNAAVVQAAARFAREYYAHDPELTIALTAETHFADLPSVQAALRELLTHPFQDPAAPLSTVQARFDDVLPAQLDRLRVNAAVAAFLHLLGDEVLYIPELQQLYTLAFQRMNVEGTRTVAANTAELVQGMHNLSDTLTQLALAPKVAELTAAAARPPQRSRPWHNLPQRDYALFVGRQAELDRLQQLLLPYPASRHFLVTLDGIGGVGKSALALETAYRYRDQYAQLPSQERFEAIIWVSAKRTLLTAAGIQARPQTFNNLHDLYRETAMVLELPPILQAAGDERRGLVERALAGCRTLLIIDNLETVDDDELLSFLRELPDPTKVIITTRHRVDIAYPIRLVGMPRDDALQVIALEAERKNLVLDSDTASELYRRTGGIPLAIVWSLGLMSLDYSIESVLRRLGSGYSDIARFCFSESVDRIRNHDAYRLLLALALFDSSTSRYMLGEVAGLDSDEIGRDDGLAELLQLSLVNREEDRFSLLPLTRAFAQEELAQHPETEAQLRDLWIAHLTKLAQTYPTFEWRWHDTRRLRQDGQYFRSLANWADQAARPDVFLGVVPALLRYYNVIGQWVEFVTTALSGLEYAQLLGDANNTLHISDMLACILSQQGYHAEAESTIKRAIKLARTQKSAEWLCDTLQTYAQILRRIDKFEQARACCDEAASLISELPTEQQAYTQANISFELGKNARDQGDWPLAQTYFLAAQQVFRLEDTDPVFNPDRAWGLLGNIGLVLQHSGDFDAAAQMYQQALAYFREAGGVGYMTTILTRLALLEEQRGRPVAAMSYAQEALERSRRLGLAQELAQMEALCARLSPPPQQPLSAC